LLVTYQPRVPGAQHSVLSLVPCGKLRAEQVGRSLSHDPARRPTAHPVGESLIRCQVPPVIALEAEDNVGQALEEGNERFHLARYAAVRHQLGVTSIGASLEWIALSGNRSDQDWGASLTV
jgi:hypothetical protein